MKKDRYVLVELSRGWWGVKDTATGTVEYEGKATDMFQRMEMLNVREERLAAPKSQRVPQ